MNGMPGLSRFLRVMAKAKNRKPTFASEKKMVWMVVKISPAAKKTHTIKLGKFIWSIVEVSSREIKVKQIDKIPDKETALAKLSEFQTGEQDPTVRYEIWEYDLDRRIETFFLKRDFFESMPH